MNPERDELCKKLIMNLTRFDPGLSATSYRYYAEDGAAYTIRIEREQLIKIEREENEQHREGDTTTNS